MELEELNYFSEYIQKHLARPQVETSDVYEKLFSAVWTNMSICVISICR